MSLEKRSVIYVLILFLMFSLLPAIPAGDSLTDDKLTSCTSKPLLSHRVHRAPWHRQGRCLAKGISQAGSYLQTRVFMAAFAEIPVSLSLSGLVMGMSIFALFGVYQGGRSNHRRFHDRTPDSINLLRGIFSVTALLRAVFVFQFVEPQPAATNEHSQKNPIPILIHNTRRYNHAFNC